jgi:carbon starvation protein
MSGENRPLVRKRICTLVWALVAVLGAFAVAVLARSRGEPVNALWMVVAGLCTFVIAYRFHSAWLLARVLTVDDSRATPAVTNADGRDYVKTHKWVVFGHHFAAIAGPGPLVGPVLAAQFGFLPGMLWILVGATLGGAVHDSVILFCSTRRGGKSLAQMMRDEVGPFAGILALFSIVAIMVIILAVLGLVVVRALAESPWGLFTILATVPVAMLMGGAMRYTKLHIGLISAFGVAGLLLAVVGGQWIHGTVLERWLLLDGRTLAVGIMIYGVLASVLPVWLLLAPRDYLSTFMKIGSVALLAVAIIILAPTLKMPALTRFIDGTGPVFAGGVFPFCFITIACAAISGFHAIISSGITPKIIARESDIRVVAYGSMVTEMLVGIMALIAACVLEPGEYFAINMRGEPAAVTAQVTQLGFPVTTEQMETLAADVGERSMVGRTGGAPTFAVGMAHMFAGVVGSKGALALWYHFAIMFEALFILTTIDAGTRVGRFLLQDLLGLVWKPLARTDSTLGNWTASVGFVLLWGYFLYQGVVDPFGGINSLWPIFGVANQLMAVIALCLGTTVLLKMGRQRYLWVPLLPLIWLLSVTVTAGWQKIFSPDPRLGFLSAAARYRDQISDGGSVDQVAQWQQLLTSQYVNSAVTGAFLILVILVVLICARLWWRLRMGEANLPLREEPYVLSR